MSTSKREIVRRFSVKNSNASIEKQTKTKTNTHSTLSFITQTATFACGENVKSANETFCTGPVSSVTSETIYVYKIIIVTQDTHHGRRTTDNYDDAVTTTLSRLYRYKITFLLIRNQNMNIITFFFLYTLLYLCPRGSILLLIMFNNTIIYLLFIHYFTLGNCQNSQKTKHNQLGTLFKFHIFFKFSFCF